MLEVAKILSKINRLLLDGYSPIEIEITGECARIRADDTVKIFEPIDSEALTNALLRHGVRIEKLEARI